MNAKKENTARSKPNEAKIISLESQNRIRKKGVVEKTISEIYFDSLKEIDDLISNEGMDIY